MLSVVYAFVTRIQVSVKAGSKHLPRLMDKLTSACKLLNFFDAHAMDYDITSDKLSTSPVTSHLPARPLLRARIRGKRHVPREENGMQPAGAIDVEKVGIFEELSPHAPRSLAHPSGLERPTETGLPHASTQSSDRSARKQRLRLPERWRSRRSSQLPPPTACPLPLFFVSFMPSSSLPAAFSDKDHARRSGRGRVAARWARERG